MHGGTAEQSAQQRHLITKQASGSAKIAPLMATFNAIPLMSANS
jgi:phage terminase large subunit-like protein